MENLTTDTRRIIICYICHTNACMQYFWFVSTFCSDASQAIKWQSHFYCCSLFNLTFV